MTETEKKRGTVHGYEKPAEEEIRNRKREEKRRD